MTKIYTKILERKKNYNSETKNILNLLSEKIDKAMFHVIKEDRKFEWFSIELVSENKNFLFIKGICQLQIGDVFVDNDERVLITDENLSIVGNVDINLVLPVKVIDDGTPLEIYDNIQIFYSLKNIMHSEKFQKLFEDERCVDYNFILDNMKNIDKIKPALIAGFDTNRMSEDQINNLSLYVLHNENIERIKH